MRRYHRTGQVESAALCPEETAHEFLVVCPTCKTMETLISIDGHLLTNRKFFQNESGIFHNCGSAVPCRIYGRRPNPTAGIEPGHPDLKNPN